MADEALDLVFNKKSLGPSLCAGPHTAWQIEDSLQILVE